MTFTRKYLVTMALNIFVITFLMSAPLITAKTLEVNASSLQTNVYEYSNLNMDRNGSELLTFSTNEIRRDKNLNLTAITWAHAVNSQAELDEALNSDIDMIEADIVLGKINNTGPDLPVMGHPPIKTSDISLEEFIDRIMKFNSLHSNATKGIKLDFKSIEVFEGSLDILHKKIPEMTYPIWLNADIIKGPVNNILSTPVDPDRFFAGALPFTEAVLSVGWTTRWGSNFVEGEYTSKHINDMIDAIKSNNVTDAGHPITFPVRAGIAANSRSQLHELVQAVNETNESTLTIWSSANDYVDVEKLRELIFDFGLDRVYLDVPENLSSQLDLGRGNAASSLLPGFWSFSLISICMLVGSLWLQK